MLEKRTFIGGGMNKSLDDRLLPPNDWKDAWNIRINSGAVENVMGNEFITGVGVDPNDDVKVIGSYEDKNNKKIYYFLYAVDQYNNILHCIMQYDIVTEITTPLVFANPNLNFSKDHLITGIAAIDDKYLLWTDDYNEPGFLNLTKARNGELIQATTQELRLIPYAPIDVITYSYESDTTFYKNNLRGGLWQFKYRFVYEDNRKSAFSPISRITYPNEFFDGGGYGYNYNNIQPTINNTIALQVPISSIKNISKIEIAARDSNLSDFKIVKTLLTENAGYDNFDISDGFNGLFSVKFKNEEPSKDVAINESNSIFSYVPLKAKGLDIVNNNRVVLANITEGFDNINLSNSSAGVINTNIRPGSSTPSGSFTNEGVFKENSPDYSDLGFTFHAIKIGDVYPGQTYSLVVTSAEPITKTYSYTTNSSTTKADISNYFISQINSDFRDNNNANGLPFFPPRCVTASSFFTTWGSFGVTEGTYLGVNISTGATITTNLPSDSAWIIINKTGNEDENRILTVAVSISSVSLVDRTSLPSFKTNSFHKFGIVYYDEAGRASTVQTNNRFLMYAPPFSNSVRGQVYGSISITHIPPTWARKYQIVYSGSLGYLNDPAEGRGFMQFIVNKATIQQDSAVSGQRTWKVAAESIYWFSQKYNQNPLIYTWKKGDKLRVLKNSAGNWNNSNSREYNILGYNTGNLEFIIESPDGGQPEEGELCEVYSPSNNISSDLFYETGYVFDIIDGQHQGNLTNQIITNGFVNQAATSSFICGDVFIRNRTMPLVDPTSGTSEQTELIEDSHYSDFYRSNSYNKGRPNIFSLDEKNIKRESSVRYSEFYIPDTNINGLGMFYDTSFLDYDKMYGSIQKIRSKGKSLVVFQETKVGKVLVNEQILSDLAAFEAVQKSDSVLSDITYYAEDFGIGKNPESFAEFANSMYFVDAYRGAILRISLAGIDKISRYGLHSYFTKELPKYINNNLWGVYCEQLDGYFLSFSDIGDYSGYSVFFHEPSNRFTSFFNFSSDCSVTHGVNILTFKGSKGYLHNSPNVPYCNFYGVQYPSSVEIAFNENPSNTKIFTNIEVESNKEWSCLLSNQRGQTSSLIKEDFDKIENVYWASLYKDINSPGGLIEGDDLRSPELIIKLSNDSTNFVKLFAVGLKYEFSELTNR